LSMRNDSALGLKPQYLVALDFPSINAGVNIIHTFINPDIYVGEITATCYTGALAPNHTHIVRLSCKSFNPENPDADKKIPRKGGRAPAGEVMEFLENDFRIVFHNWVVLGGCVRALLGK
jgi:hypothetical protein